MIETKQMLLRPFDCDDLDIIMKLYSNEDIMEYMHSPVLDQSGAQLHLSKIVDEWKATPQIHYEMAVVCKETNEKIGRAEITRNYPEESVMIGLMLLKEMWGNGFATEIANALIAYCFDHLRVHRVYSLCHPDNIASWKVMEKCGMHKEAHYIQKCKYTKTDGIQWEEELEYAIVR